MRPTWDEWFMGLARYVSTRSKDESTKVGAVVIRERAIISTGYNGFPPGIEETQERLERPEKYYWTEHAERNCLYFGAAFGHALAGGTMYTTAFPCADCARGIIRAGLVRVVAPAPPEPINVPGDWRLSCKAAYAMLKAAGVEVTEME